MSTETPTDATEPEAPATEQDLLDEGDAAADYIEELLDIADLDGDIDIEARLGRAYVSVSSSEGGDLSLLSKPDTVAALQELTRLAVQAKTGRFSRLILDIGGSRDARADELAALVDHAISRLEAAPRARRCRRCRATSARCPRPRRRARLHLGVRGRGAGPPHGHPRRALTRPFHVKHRDRA